MGLIQTGTKLRNNLWQVVHTYVAPSPCSITWYWLKDGDVLRASLAESNGSLPPGMTYRVTCKLTACIPGSALGQTLGNEYGRTLLCYFMWSPVQHTIISGQVMTSLLSQSVCLSVSLSHKRSLTLFRSLVSTNLRRSRCSY